MQSPSPEEPMYQVPARFRFFENLHIVFWLIKDISWAMLWKPLGMVMIIPTLTLAIKITIQTRYIKSELYHNLAIVCWICANCTWMTFEFFWPEYDYLRYYTAIPFVCGIGFIAYYYLVLLPATSRRPTVIPAVEPVHLTNEPGDSTPMNVD
ncbi:hypothetical protein [Parapedobacter pyrenivorans]|nr:hypothetical protein [Parapedobacter pyrenivorans]